MRLTLVVGFCLILGNFPALAQDIGSDASRGRAVELARQGRLDQALTMLDALHRADPDDVAVIYDYIVVLGWAERDREALEQFRSIERDRAPDYVVEAAARSSRNLGRHDDALDLYRYGKSRWPDNAAFAVGEVHTLLDAGDDEAFDAAERLADARPRDADALAVQARALRLQGEYADALAVATRALAIEPDHRGALRMRIFALSELGSPGLALAHARKYPGLLNAAELERLEANAIAYRIRSAQMVRPMSEEDRFARIDSALAELDRRIAGLEGDPAAGPALLNARYDRIVALRDRFRMREVVAEHGKLTAAGAEPPSYVLSAVGDALLYLHHPEEALGLYRKALVSAPHDFETRLQMAYALAEAGELDEAIGLADRLYEEEPIWLPTVEGKSLLENPRRVAAAQARVDIRISAGDIDGARQLSTRMAEMAPRNSLGYGALGGAYLAHGWPRQALAEFDQGLAVEALNRTRHGGIYPTYGLETGRASALLELHEYRQVEAQQAALGAEYPEQLQVQALRRQWEIHNRRELHMEALAGFTDGDDPQAGDRALELRTRLFSAPFAYNFRALAGYEFSQADFEDVGIETLHRAVAGLEYRGGDWELTAEGSYNTDTSSEPGGRLAALWTPDDYWSIEGNVEIFSRHTPLRALADGVTANSAELEGTYRASETFELSLGGRLIDFDDGNFSKEVALSGRARALTRPYFRIDGGVDLSYSAYSETDVAYFSPERASTQAAVLVFSHILRQRYEDLYIHSLTLTGGNYWQQDFGSSLVGSAFYEHRLRMNDEIEFSLGVGYGHHVFDGEPEEQLSIVSRLLWSF